MTKRQVSAPPYVAAQVLGGRLVRVCPECNDEIVEVTDAAGMVSDNFAAHWEVKHRERPPEQERCYVLALAPRTDGQPGPGPEALRDLSRQILNMVKEQMAAVDWELVERVEDLPEGAPALIASDVLRGSWGMEGDDPQLRNVRWYRRENDSLVFTPTAGQWDEWNASRDRASDFRAALIERHRSELPKFTGKTAAGWERSYERLKREQDAIAESFDTQRDAAMDQFLRGNHRWQATLEAAIADLAIPHEEVDELRERRRARLEEVEAMLNAEPAV
jgi:hypothetical protein